MQIPLPFSSRSLFIRLTGVSLTKRILSEEVFLFILLIIPVLMRIIRFLLFLVENTTLFLQ